MENIKNLFEPRSIAVIGASRDNRKIGHKVLHNIISGGFAGKIYPVNPGGGSVLGMDMYRTVSDIQEEIDIVCTTIPEKFVFDSVRECADRGVKYNLIITSGFSEVGNIAEEKRIAEYARDRGMRIIGPNIFGIYSAVSSLDATFGPGSILPGSVAIITQSGALGLAMIGKTTVENIGLSAIVSVGNKCDVDESDLLEYLIDQEETKVILMYIEGIKEGRRFIDTVKKATLRKPVIVIKSGRSKRGADAAASHTGSLAGADEVTDAILRQCGAIRAESIQDAFNWSKYLSQAPCPANGQAVIITNGGGVGVMATDACEKYNIDLYNKADTLHKAFSDVTPGFGSTRNPIDITGGAAAPEYNAALGAALESNEIGASIALYCETATFLADDVERVLDENYKKYMDAQKPVLFAIVGGEDIKNVIAKLNRKNVPVFGDVYEAVSCLGKLYEYHNYVKYYSNTYEDVPINLEAIETVCKNAITQNRYFLLAHEAKEIMEHIGITMPKSGIARSLNEAITLAETIGYPVVMKVVSRDIIHKSDAGGVALDLENREEVIDAYQAIHQSCRQYKPDAFIEGVELAEMLTKEVETIIGARHDTIFGPVIMFGLGGIYVEVMKDVSFRAVPLPKREIVSMIKETRSYPLLLGVRGEEKKDIESLIATIVKLGALIRKCTIISDIEINPLIVYEQGNGVKALDVRILLSQQ